MNKDKDGLIEELINYLKQYKGTIFDAAHISTCLAEMVLQSTEVYLLRYQTKNPGVEEFNCILDNDMNYLWIPLKPDKNYDNSDGSLYTISMGKALLHVFADDSVSGLYIEYEGNGVILDVEDINSILQILVAEKKRILRRMKNEDSIHDVQLGK